MLTLILGTDWVSNRRRILDLISQDVINASGGRYLIVPESVSHDTERRLCASAGDTASRYVEVLSFSRLCSRVSDFAGHAQEECLDNGGRVVAMAAAARQLHSKLKAYAAVETRPEFLISLVDAIDEFKQCCITSDDLKLAAAKSEGSLAQKLEELALLLESYDALCAQGKRDPRDQMSWLLNELEECDFAKQHVFYIDGFPDFTHQHMAILEHLIAESSSITVSLTCDAPGSAGLSFENAGDTALKLIHIAQKNNVAYQICYEKSRSDMLQPVRELLFQGKITPNDSINSLCTYQTESIYQECIAAAEKVMNLVRNGARYRDIGIACSDLNTYRNTLEMTFSRCHIPVYLSGTEQIIGKPVIVTVLAALDAVISGFDQQNVLAYTRSLLSPIDFAACDMLENYAILWGIDKDQWLAQWSNHPDGLGGRITENSQITLCELNLIRQRIMDPLHSLRENIYKAENLGQQIEALYRFMEQIQIRQRLGILASEMDANGDYRSAQILNQLWEILLNAIEQMYDVLGQTVWEPEIFSRLLKLLLSQYDVGTIPPVLDTVTVGSVSAMQCHQVKNLLVLGAQEGAFPAYVSSSGVLSDQERNALRGIGIPLVRGAMEGLQQAFTEIYGVFCGAEETVTVSCSNGQPSFIYRRLSELSGSSDTADCLFGAALADPVEAAAFLARFNAEEVSTELGLTQQFYDAVVRKNYNFGNIQPQHIKKLYGDTLELSASQIDRQGECRLSYFLKYGLRANERKPAAVDPAEFGTYVHFVLENTAKHIQNIGGFHSVSMDEAVKIAEQYSIEYAKERFSVFGDQRTSYLFQRNSRELSLIVQELWKELHDCEFEAVGFEVGFGFDESRAAIPISGKIMNARLRGFIDRVDVWKSDTNSYFRVVDYKTGRKDFDYCDIFNGLGLQMLLYLFALENAPDGLCEGSAVSAGVQYFPARVPIVSADGLMSPEEVAAAREKLWKRKGLVLNCDAVLQAMESADAPNRMPYTRKKDGAITGDIADAAQFALLKAYVFGVVGKMVDDIASGNVTPNPYTRGSAHDACTFCPYSSVCHLENVHDRRNYKTMSPQRFWDEVGKEVSNHG